MGEKTVVDLICNATRAIYETEDFIPLHAPIFIGKEKEYLNHCIDSTFVSSVGQYVNELEEVVASYFGEGFFCAAVVNGTAALTLSLSSTGIQRGDEVLTQDLTFVATANAISHTGGVPHFLDVDRETLSLCPKKLEHFLTEKCRKSKDGFTYNKETGSRVFACIPMHTFGFAGHIEAIRDLCKEYNIVLIEDAAESLGSQLNNRQLGTFGKLAAISLNGNKVITSGGGGLVISRDEELIKKIKHISSTAKIPHSFHFDHDQIAHNFRMPNINAALALAQFENLDFFLEAKKGIFKAYDSAFESTELELIQPLPETSPNFWLNAVLINENLNLDSILETINSQGVMVRPVWKPMSQLEIYKNAPRQDVSITREISQRLINLPSGLTEKTLKKYSSGR